jgi:transposase-like protein
MIMEKRSVDIDHVTLNRRGARYPHSLPKTARNRKFCPIGSWRMDETCIKVDENGNILIGD